MKLSLLPRSACFQSSLRNVLALLLVFMSVVPSAVSQCCQKFLNGQCITCPPDTRLVLGNCLLNKPNCMAYNVFQCIKCNVGYTLDSNNLCVSLSQQDPLSGYFYLTQAEINSNFIQALVTDIKKKISPKLPGLNLIAAIAANANQVENLEFPLVYKYYFRFIFSADQGFLQYNYEYNPSDTNSTNTYTADSIPNLAEFAEKKVKIITINDENNFNEIFIDFRQDPYSALIIKDLETRRIKTTNTKFIDVFRYFAPAFENIPAAYGYRIFLMSPNQGLFYVTKIIEIQTVDVFNLDALIMSVLEQIKRMKNWQKSLNNTQLVKLVIINTKGGVSTYNATYQHLGVTDPRTKSLAKSWVVFTWQQMLKTIKIDVVNSFIWVEQPPTTTLVKAATSNPVITPITTPARPTPPQRKTPSWDTIPNNINLQEYISLLQFFKLKDFSSILGYLNVNYMKYTVGQDLIRASQGENATHKIYEIQFKVYSLEQINSQYVFTLDKDKNQLDIAQFILTTAKNRTDIVVDSRNRRSVVKGFDVPTEDIFKNIVIPDPLYSSNAELFEHSTIVYKTSESANPIMRISLRYYFPTQLNKTYEFVEYRGEIKDYQSNSSNKSVEKINTIVYPKEAYQLIDDTDALTRDSVIFAVQQLLISQLSNINYTFTRVFKSLDRIGYFRVEINYMELYIVLYEFDSNSNTYLRSITNKTISTAPRRYWRTYINRTETISKTLFLKTIVNSSNSTADSKRLLLGASQAPLDPIPPKAYNPLYFFQYFPSKIKKSTQLGITLPFFDSAFLTQSQLRMHIANFFNISLESIVNVNILNLETLEELIDTYYVQFTKLNLTGFNIKGINKIAKTFRFTFQIDRKTKKSLQNIASAARDSQTQLSLRRSNQVFGLSWMLTPFVDLLNKAFQGQSKNTISNQENNTIVIPFEQCQNKPAKILEEIFSRSIKISNQKQPNSNALSFKQKSLDEFIKNIPKIIPIKYEQDASFGQIPASELKKPNKPTTQAINFASKKLNLLNMYSSSLSMVDAQRDNKNTSKNKVNLINIHHAYYGNIMAWCSLADIKVIRIDYMDEFCMKNRGISIIKQIPQLTNVHQLLSNKISKTLTYFGYEEQKSPKVVKETDIIYWKYKKLTNTNQIELYYEFDTFLIKANVLMSQQENKIAQLIVINDNKKANNKLADLRRILYSNNFMKANYQLFFEFGYYFQDGEIISVDQKNQGENVDYFVLFYTPQGFINASMTYNIPTLKTTINSITELSSKSFSNLMQGCQTLSQTPLKCKQCYSQYYLHKNDKTCYLKIQNCSYQSRQICLECENGYFLSSDDRCQ